MKARVTLLAFLLQTQSASAGDVSGKVPLGDEESAEATVVYIEKVPEGSFPPPPELPRLSQKGAKFSPLVLPVVRGTKVDLTNDDWVTHSVFSKSKAKTFDLGLYAKGTKQYIEFDTLGVVELFCSIHPRMNAVILVLQNPHFMKPAEDGSFRLTNVPAGTHRLHVYQAGQPERVLDVRVPGKGVVVVDLPKPAP